jgi:hypothetical protein
MEVYLVAGPGRPTRELQRLRAHSRANQRARQRLVELHREEYRALLEAEKAREGIATLRPREIPAEAAS